MNDLLREEDLSPEEQEVKRDEAVAVEATPEPAEKEYLEFVGTDTVHGTTFSTGHIVSRKDMREVHDLSMPKDLEWKKGKNGRFLVPVADMTPEVADVLEQDPMFKRVTIKN